MPKYISKEKRLDIIFHKQNGETDKVIAEYMRVSTRTVGRVWRAYREYGKIEANTRNCGRRSVINEE